MSVFDPLRASIERRIVAVQGRGEPLFRLMRLRPPHGWPAVWWELTIVTLGVLIALTADQVVRALHSRATVAEFRRAADKEIAFNLAAFEYRLEQERCLQKRLSDLAS
ncbi:MAG TPA: hypothetical protein VE403_04125, partial [Sphingomicrobium sp.]|nr:hypothetical protein [Sphingomicrobium sp.]